MSRTQTRVSLVSLAGTSYYITALAESLADRPDIGGVQVFVPASSPEVETLPDDRDGVDVVALDVDSDLARSFVDVNRPAVLRTILSRLDAFDVDLVHVVNEMRVPFYLPYLVRRRLGVSTVLTVHEPDPYLPTPVRRYALNPIQTYNLKALARSIDRYVVHCPSLVDRLAPHVPDTDDVVSVPHGTLAPYFTRWADGNVPTRKEVLFFGRAAPGKGLPTLVRAGRELTARLPEVEVTVAGSGYDPEQFGRLDDDDGFTVVDSRVPESDAAELFQRAAVVVMPYRDASASGIPSIAGGFDTPVVATNVGCLPSLVQHERGGLIVEPEDPDALRDALSRLLTDEELRRELGETLGEMHESTFSWDRVAERTAAVYEAARAERQ